MDFSKLSMNEKIGQKFMFGVNSHNIDDIVYLIKKYYIGGVILYKKNYNNYNEMLSVIKRLKEANKDNKIPLFIAIDQEGGRVNRMPSDFKNIRNVYDMSKKSLDLVYDNGMLTGKILFQSGINVNFAPVLDIYDDNGSKVLYKRCFYGDVDNISKAGIKYIEGLNNNCVLSVVKHFPGHGISKIDSHFMTPFVFNKNALLERHIKPFEVAIKNNIDALMVGHLVIRGITGGVPASISSYFINEYIRNNYKYEGLVITDDISMLSRSVFRIGCLKRAFLSGSDIILIKLKGNCHSIVEKVIGVIKNNDKYLSILDDNVRRIIKFKEKYKITDDISFLGCNVDEINAEIDKLNSFCD